MTYSVLPCANTLSRVQRSTCGTWNAWVGNHYYTATSCSSALQGGTEVITPGCSYPTVMLAFLLTVSLTSVLLKECLHMAI